MSKGRELSAHSTKIVSDFPLKFEEPYSARTIRQAYVLDASIVHGAQEDELISQVVLTKKPELPKDRLSDKAMFLAVGQVESILNGFETAEPRYYPFVRLLFETGLRIGEAAALLKSDVDLWAGTITVSKTVSMTRCHVGPTKSGKTRVVPIDTDMVRVLRKYMRDYPTTSTRLFTTHTGHQLRPTVFRQRVWRDVVESVQDWTTVPMPHAARHYFASSMIMAGVPLLTVSRLLGHANIGITSDIYGHLSPDAGAAAIALRATWMQQQRELDRHLMGLGDESDGLS